MKVNWPKPGKYAVAVSGGVDSMALLHMLNEKGGYELIVAHLDHGIRQDSAEDRILVEKIAGEYGFQFVYKEAKLGSHTSEAAARDARYEFLRKVIEKAGAEAIILAHHQDDLLETGILNMLRGTGRKGLSSLRDREGILRPLLDVTKQELSDYAKANSLEWREDPTNKNTKYLRNYIRQELLSKLGPDDKAKLVNLFTGMKATNDETDELLAGMIGKQGAELDRQWFGNLPHDAAKEVMAAWLRRNGIAGFDRKMIERLVVACKTAAPGKTFPVMSGYNIRITKTGLALGR